MSRSRVRQLAVILGDQLDLSYPEVLGLDPELDRLFMVEVAEASRSPASSIIRTATFLAAMRHHAARLRGSGWRLDYVRLDDEANTQSFEGEFIRAIKRLRPDSVVMVEPGSFAADRSVRSACAAAGVDLEITPDPHFLCSTSEFTDWARRRKSLTMEYFYRRMRKEHDILMDEGEPVGGVWNFDKENRKTFKSAPGPPPVPRFQPDETVRGTLDDIERCLPDLPGGVGTWIWPVTRDQAVESLEDFVEHRLAFFGDYQDAMWTGEATLYHSVISAPLNLKLLNPREVIAAAVGAYEAGRAPINAVEGFVRQIIGWREFIRGVYFFEGSGYERRNSLEQHGSLPEF
ncbi:MAG: cryptochrome/photolyase family protein, partial [Phycisphaerales bacterium JB041]